MTSPTAPQSAAERSPRRTMVGVVVSTKMDKTITVQVERMYKHPKYGKYIRERKRYHAHAPEGGVSTGDVVEVMSTRPISKTKRWRLVRVVTKSVERGAEVSEIGRMAAGEKGPAEKGSAERAGGDA
jgi:small subunit ribosomal protein S17